MKPLKARPIKVDQDGFVGTIEPDRLYLEDSMGSMAVSTGRAIVTDAPILTISVTADWAGCTETGFGQTASIDLPAAIIPFLKDWLAKLP